MSEVSAKHVLGLSVLLALTMAMLIVGVYVSPASGQDEPILAVEKTDSPDPVTAKSETLIYTITVLNVGTGLATNVVLNDELPDSTTFVSASSGCVFNPVSSTVTCNLGTLLPSEERDVSIVVVPQREGEIVNTAAVTSNQQTEPASVTEETQVAGGVLGRSSRRPRTTVRTAGLPGTASRTRASA